MRKAKLNYVRRKHQWDHFKLSLACVPPTHTHKYTHMNRVKQPSSWSRAGRHTWEPACSVWGGRPVVTCLQAGFTHTYTQIHTRSVAKQTNYPRCVWLCVTPCVCVCVGRRTLHQHPVTHEMFIRFVKIIFPCQGGCLCSLSYSFTRTHLGEGSPIPTAWPEMETLPSIFMAGSLCVFLFVIIKCIKLRSRCLWFWILLMKHFV